MLYKDFIAQASIAFANKMFNHYAKGAILNGSKYFYQESFADEVISDSIGMAEKLAKALEENWNSGTHGTVFFDPEDQPETIIARAISGLDDTISDKLNK